MILRKLFFVCSAWSVNGLWAGCGHQVDFKAKCFCMFVCRSIQRLEELNVGMDDLGEEVQALSQQCNGGDNNNSETREASATPQSQEVGGGASDTVTSTPQRSAGQAAFPPLTQSPVLSQR